MGSTPHRHEPQCLFDKGGLGAMWFFKSIIGIFWITQNTSGDYELWLDNRRLGYYSSPEIAADSVFRQTTGCAAWDTVTPIRKPGDLEDWGRAM